MIYVSSIELRNDKESINIEYNKEIVLKSNFFSRHEYPHKWGIYI